MNLFGSPGLARGYATARPAVHPLVIDLIRDRLNGRIFDRAIDIGCGAGLSTGALEGIASRSIGVEPARSMLQWTADTAPRSRFVVARAEALPFQRGSAGLLTAAGSLNYVADLDAFFKKACRILEPAGLLIVYDFSPGRRFRHSPSLDDWFREFMKRYPKANDSARPLDPDRLASLASGFDLSWQQQFEVGLEMNPASYERYMMTETNVGYAIEQGTPEASIRAWCRDSLPAVFSDAAQEILFEGYIACLTAR